MGSYSSELRSRGPNVLISFGLLAVVQFLFRLDWVLFGSVAAAIVVSNLAPARWAWLVNLVCWLGLAALLFFHFGQTRVAALVAVVGVVFAALAFGNRKVSASS